MASVTILRGNPSLLLQWSERDFDPTRGYLYRYNYRGGDQLLAIAAQNAYSAAGISSRLVLNQGDSATLEVTDPTQQFTIDSWEIVGNEESRDGLSHPGLSLALIGLALDPEQVIAAMRSNLANENSWQTAVAGTLAGAPAIVQRFYRLQLRGSDQYRHGQYVLRHKTNVSNRWSVNVADINVEKIYTTAQLLTEVTNATSWIYPMPGRLQYKISNIPAPTAEANYQWGWLKSSSTETNAANNRVDISTDYTLEQWTTDYYVPD